MNDTPHQKKSQDEILGLSPYQQAREYYACDHGETEIRYKTYSNGTRHFFQQCLNCGGAIGSAISHKNIDNICELSPWDHQTENAYQFMIDEMSNQLEADREQSPPIDRRDRRSEYKEYLRSDIWKSKRNRVLNRDNHLCQGCLMRAANEVHHKVYPEKFGDEPLFDLVSVCKICHNAIHRINGDE